MPPAPQSPLAVVPGGGEMCDGALPPDAVVVSGMSGCFPGADSVPELSAALYSGKNLVSDEPRWVFAHPEVPKHLGQVRLMEKFDAQFFRVHYKQAMTMEPMSRKLLEHAYQAIYDAGLNPVTLGAGGRRVGVFVGSAFSESEKTVIFETIQRNGFGITGCNKAMYANRISYWVDGKGPSYTLDVADASSAACLEHAYRALASGQCDAAVVGGCNLCMHPNVSLNMSRAVGCSLDGATRCYDRRGGGYVRADCMSVVFLQRAANARRVYCELVRAASHYTAPPTATTGVFLPQRDPHQHAAWLRTFYDDAGVSPALVQYVEGNGAAQVSADVAELSALGAVVGAGRERGAELPVGCIKSNMGHAEPAAGVAALIKLCLAYHTGVLPANLHCEQPLTAAGVRVLTQSERWGRGLAAINASAYSGVDVHVLLRGRYKRKELSRYACSVPRLVLLSGRQEAGVSEALSSLRRAPLDAEQIALLHAAHETDVPGHMCRGYALLEEAAPNEDGSPCAEPTACVAQAVEYFDGVTRPTVWVYSGMGSQWAGMGAALLALPVCAAALERCRAVLQPKGVDLLHVLTSEDVSVFDNILHAFVGIAAVQIALTDLLVSLGLKPDYIIGHSVGELGCAYADGCMTAEEMVLAAYSRGLVSLQTELTRGAMAAVGLSAAEAARLLPAEVEVACHNSADSCTISGEEGAVRVVLSDLTARGVFAREVACAHIAYHSQHIAPAGPALLALLRQVVPEPKPRSERWISTSVPQERWHEPLAQTSSAEYHTNNLLSPVLFEQGITQLPRSAVVVEVAPHGLLQAILKRAMPDAAHVPLTRRKHPKPNHFLLEAVGKLYCRGLLPHVAALYPRVQWPVSTETPFLSHLVHWEHSENWPVAKYSVKDRVSAMIRDVKLSQHDADHAHLANHRRHGRAVFPEVALLELVWETVVMWRRELEHRRLAARGDGEVDGDGRREGERQRQEEEAVRFRAVEFPCALPLPAERPLQLSITVNKGDHRFEVTSEEGAVVARGLVSLGDVADDEFTPTPETAYDDEITLTQDDVYAQLHHKDHQYSGEYRSLVWARVGADGVGSAGGVVWRGRWTPLLSALMQLSALTAAAPPAARPLRVRTLLLSPRRLTASLQQELTITNHDNIIRCGGVQLEGLSWDESPSPPAPHRPAPCLYTTHYCLHTPTDTVQRECALKTVLCVVRGQLAVTAATNEVAVAVTVRAAGELHAALTAAGLRAAVTLRDVVAGERAALVAVTDVLADAKKLKMLIESLDEESFALLEENAPLGEAEAAVEAAGGVVSAAWSVPRGALLLLRRDVPSSPPPLVVSAVSARGGWCPRVRSALANSDRRVLIVAENQPADTVLPVWRALAAESAAAAARLDVLVTADAPAFSLALPLYSAQLRKRLRQNVYQQEGWGAWYCGSVRTASGHAHAVLAATHTGDLDSLAWLQATAEAGGAGGGEGGLDTVRVAFAALSARDAQRALRCRRAPLGQDFSGTLPSGERVMGVTCEGALATEVGTGAGTGALVWPLPAHWSLQDAATVPLPYLLAYYVLMRAPNFHRGCRVLVVGGCGALAQALLALCLHCGCEVYAAVANAQRKQYLITQFPGLKVENVGNSRDLSFEQLVAVRTGGAFCHVVVAAAATRRQREAAMRCVTFEGWLLDVTQRDAARDATFGMQYLSAARHYRAVRLETIFRPDHRQERELLRTCVAEGISAGAVRPLARMVLPAAEATRAARLAAAARCPARILLEIPPPQTPLNAEPRLWCTGAAAVVADTAATTAALAERLAERGARSLLLHCERPSPLLTHALRRCSAMGVEVELSSSAAELAARLAGAEEVRAVLVAAAGPRLAALLPALHRATEHTPRLQQFMVVVTEPADAESAGASGAAAALCRQRRDAGLPAVYLDCSHYPEEWLSVLDAAAHSPHAVLLSPRPVHPTPQQIYARLQRIIGVGAWGSEDTALGALQLGVVALEELLAALQQLSPRPITPQMLHAATIQQVLRWAMECCSDGAVAGDEDGEGEGEVGECLSAFVDQVEDDETLATEPVVALNTALASYASRKEEEVQSDAPHVVLLPGLGGDHAPLTDLALRLRARALAAQLTPDMTHRSLADIAAHVHKAVRTRVSLRSPFYLVGHSFGVLVALELAALLEQEGLEGVVVCVDSSPLALRAQLSARLGELGDDTRLQDAVATHLYALMGGREDKRLAAALLAARDWPAKVDACVSLLRGIARSSQQYQRERLQATLARIMLARDYRPALRLRSRLVLLRGRPHPGQVALPADYGLAAHTEKPVEVVQLRAGHAAAVRDCRAADAINRQFNADMQAAYRDRYDCQVYLAEAVKII